MASRWPTDLRRDIASAYLASAAKVGSWVVVAAVLYRVVTCDSIVSGLTALVDSALATLS